MSLRSSPVNFQILSKGFTKVLGRVENNLGRLDCFANKQAYARYDAFCQEEFLPRASDRTSKEKPVCWPGCSLDGASGSQFSILRTAVYACAALTYGPE